MKEFQVICHKPHSLPFPTPTVILYYNDNSSLQCLQNLPQWKWLVIKCGLYHVLKNIRFTVLDFIEEQTLRLWRSCKENSAIHNRAVAQVLLLTSVLIGLNLSNIQWEIIIGKHKFVYITDRVALSLFFQLPYWVLIIIPPRMGLWVNWLWCPLYKSIFNP